MTLHLNLFNAMIFSIVLVISMPLHAQSSSGKGNNTGTSSRYGAVTPTQVYTLSTRLNMALLTASPIRSSGSFPQIKSMEPVMVTGKTPVDVFLRTQRICDLIDQLLHDVGMSAMVRVTPEGSSAIPAEVYLSIANCLDALNKWAIHQEQGRTTRSPYQKLDFTDKTPSDVYGLVDLAVRRLELFLGVPSSVVSEAFPAPHTKTNPAEVRPQPAVVKLPKPVPPMTSEKVEEPVRIIEMIPAEVESQSTIVKVLKPAPPVTSEKVSDPVQFIALSPAEVNPQPAVMLVSNPAPPVKLEKAIMPVQFIALNPAALEHKDQVSMGKLSSSVPAPEQAREPAPEPTMEPAAKQDPAGVKRPGYKFLRHAEDWSSFKDSSEADRTDLWDDAKYVPLGRDGSAWASFGGHLRLRMEDWSGFAFGAPADSNESFNLWRLMLHSDLHFGENVRGYFEIKSAQSSERDLPGGRRAGLDVDSFALQQGFLDLKFPSSDGTSLTIRTGRQMFLFGKQRLVSPLPWANNLRAWDGVSAIFKLKKWKLHGFYSQFVPVRKYDYNRPDSQTEFFGMYASGKILDSKYGLDAYFLGLLKDDPVTFNGTTGAEKRYTIGSRFYGKIPDTRFDFDVEAAFQFGKVGTGDISAFMFASELGYKLPDWWGSPRFKIGFDYASGDDSAGGDVETFNQLFPLGHAYFGYMDFVARQNVIDISPGVTFKPMDKLTLSATGHLFFRAESTDALYNAGGGVVRAGGLGADNEIGSEIDFILKYKFDRHLSGLLGYSHFFAGDFIEESGTSEDMDFIYAQMQYTF